MKNLLAVALVVSVASVALSQSLNGPQVFVDEDDVVVPDSPFKAQRTQKWEYKVSERAGMNPGVVENQLNNMAKEGWELSQIDQREGLYIFRRPVQERPEQVFLERLFEVERHRVEMEGEFLLPKER